MIQRLLLIVCLSFWLVSCETTSFVSLEIQRPAQVNLKFPISKIVVVDHAVSQPNNFGHTMSSFSKKQTNQTFSAEYFHTLFVSSFVRKLRANPDFKVELKQIKSDKLFTESTPVMSEELNQIVTDEQPDLIISLDKFILGSALKLSYVQAENIFRLTFDATHTATFNFYQKGQVMVNQRLNHVDSLYWENFDYTSESVASKFPDLKLCMADLISHSVDDLYKKVFSNTEIVQRTLYESSQSDMMDATRYTHKNKWKEASYIWEYWYKNSKNNRLRGFCAANLALYSEISDNFDQAISWANVAKEKFEADGKSNAMGEPARMADYIKDLKIRKEQVKLLEQTK